MSLRAVRELVHTRCRGLCERCGLPLAERWELHHRRPGGMGGTRRAGQHTPSNLLALHPDCHNLTPGSVHALGPHHAGGWLLSTHTPDPGAVPVLLHGRRLVTLTDAGGYLPAA